jgi:hypothetical protein
MLQTKQLLQRILQENDDLYQAQREAVSHPLSSLLSPSPLTTIGIRKPPPALLLHVKSSTFQALPRIFRYQINVFHW